MATTKEDRSFKQLINKRVTSADKQFYEEIGDETLIVTGDQIWAETITNDDPDAAVLAGLSQFYSKLELIEDVTVADQESWFAQDVDGYRIKDWISDRFGSSYTLKLFDNNDNEIFPTDALNWFWDYPTGILTISGDTSSFAQPFKVDGYTYIGEKGVGSGSGTTVVTDQSERLALTPDLGDLVYQEDVQTTYQWATSNSSTPSWRVVKLLGQEDPFFGGGPAIYYYVDPAGDDTNDGRASGPTRAKQTISAVFQDINDSGGVIQGYITIVVAPGSYSEGSGLSLEVPVEQDIYIIAAMGSFVNNESVTVSSDNGIIADSAIQRDITTSAFTSFTDGERFAWVGDGVSPNGDAFPTMLGALKDSTSPNLRMVTFSAPSGTFNISQWEVSVDCLGIKSQSNNTHVFVYGIELDNSSAINVSTYLNTFLNGCRLLSTGGTSTINWHYNSFTNGTVSNSHIEATDDINVISSGSGSLSFNQCNIVGTQLDIFDGKIFINNLVTDRGIRFGAYNPTDGQNTSGWLARFDLLGATYGIRVGGFASVRQLDDGYAPNFTGTLLQVNENGRFTRQFGDLYASNIGLTGPCIIVSQMSQAINVSDYTGILTTPIGNDIKVGSGPAISFSTLSSLGGVTDLDELSRAT